MKIVRGKGAGKDTFGTLKRGAVFELTHKHTDGVYIKITKVSHDGFSVNAINLRNGANIKINDADRVIPLPNAELHTGE